LGVRNEGLGIRNEELGIRNEKLGVRNEGLRMGSLAEALILYIVLFFSGAAGFIINGGQNVDFSISAQIAGIFLHSLPSLALIWLLILKTKSIEDCCLKPARKDLISALITLPCLLLIGFAISSVSSFIGGSEAQLSFNSPSTVSGRLILCLSFSCSAYLEESYFRYYLLTKRNELKLNAPSALILSTALFSICHIYEGPWGVLNAAASGALLCLIFLRTNSLHGIAIAHGLYNILIFMFFNG